MNDMTWMTGGSCQTSPLGPDAWTPERGRPRTDAQCVCLACPIVAECRAWGIAHPRVAGIWGGLSQAARRQASSTGVVPPLTRSWGQPMTEEKVREIRRAYRPGMRYSELGRQFGVSGDAVSDIVRRKSWRDVEDDGPTIVPATRPYRVLARAEVAAEVREAVEGGADLREVARGVAAKRVAA